INGGKKDIYSRDHQEAGKFSYYTDELKASDKVEVVLFDANYKELARKNVPIVAPDPIVITKVDTYTEGSSTFVKGTYSGKGVKYIDVVVNDDEKMSYQLSKDQKPGTFQYYTGNLNLKATDDVKVRLYNSDRKVVAQKQVPIEARSSVTITGVEKYIVGDSMSVSGTYEGEGVAKIKLVVNGIDKMAYPLHTLKTFSYYYNELKATDNVKIVLLDSNSRVLAEAKVTVEDESPSNVSITSVNEYIEGKTEYVSGLYKGEGVISANLIINGTPINKVWLEKEPKGTFKYYERNLKVTDDVQIVLYNKKGKEVARKQVVIKEKNKVKE
ncbi:hypothetical protein JKN29_002840, partial [Enterococcus faecalis]|nr:hypothetical protein [Enterococcus faecalis]